MPNTSPMQQSASISRVTASQRTRCSIHRPSALPLIGFVVSLTGIGGYGSLVTDVAKLAEASKQLSKRLATRTVLEFWICRVPADSRRNHLHRYVLLCPAVADYCKRMKVQKPQDECARLQIDAWRNCAGRGDFDIHTDPCNRLLYSPRVLKPKDSKTH
jgi:hypothetical protein